MRPISPLCILLIACGSNSGDPADTDTEEPRLDQVDLGEIPADPSDETPCTTDEDCDDSDPCTEDICVPDGTCTHDTVDSDSDGFIPETCGGEDCDDDDDSIHPEATEICGDGIDQDCNSLDEGLYVRTSVETEVGTSRRVTEAAWTGSEFGIVIEEESRSLRFARVRLDGLLQGTDLYLTSTGSMSDPALAWTGSEFGLAWTDNRDGNSEIYFTRISSTGAQVGAELRVTDDAESSNTPSLSWTGSEFGLAWTDTRDANGEIYFTRLTADGAKIMADARITDDAEASYFPRLAWVSSAYALSWVDTRLTPPIHELFYALLDSTGAKTVPDTRISDEPGHAWAHHMVWSGSDIALAWLERESTDDGLYFARIDPDGTHIVPNTKIPATTINDTIWDLLWTGSEYGMRISHCPPPCVGLDAPSEAWIIMLDTSGAPSLEPLNIHPSQTWSHGPLLWTDSWFYAPVWNESPPATLSYFIDYCD